MSSSSKNGIGNELLSVFKIVDAGLKMVVLNPCNENTVAMTIMTTVCLLFVFSSSIFFVCLIEQTL